MSKVQTNQLTDLQLRKWLRTAEPLAKSDGGGLTFTLSANGTATWILRFRCSGRRQEITLGRYPELSLAAARTLAARKRLSLTDGVNPADELRRAKSHQDWSVRELINDYRQLVLSTFAKSTQCSYGRNLKRIEHGMGAMSVRSVTALDVVSQIERVKVGWVERFTLWCVLRGIFKHAAGKRLIVSNPCAGIQLDSVIGKRPDKRTRLMLTEEELVLLMKADMKPENSLAVRILLATGVRTSELNTAKRDDVYLDEGRWHIPASKTGPSMDIPLAPVVTEWLKELMSISGESAYVFAAFSRARKARFEGDTHQNKDAIRSAIYYWMAYHSPDIRRFSPHDLRSTMKSHMRKLGVSREISEMCLNHKLSGVEGVYDQHTYFEERRAALEKWADYLSRISLK